MGRKQTERRLFTRRVFIINSIKIFLGMGVVSRLAYLQIFKSNHYKLRSDKNRIVTTQILPERGNILDCKGNIIATNKSSYSVSLDLFDISKAERSTFAQKIIDFVTLDEETTSKLKNIDQSKNRFILLEENVDWKRLSTFYMLSSRVPGINIEKSLIRHYVNSDMYSHITGYTGSPTVTDIENSDNVSIRLPTAKIGKCCIEKQYEEKLFGTSGIKHTEVNSKRQSVRILEEIKSIPGSDIHLTINKELQDFVYKRLSEEESAACVVMDIHSGAILAFVSYPGYDSNIFNTKIDKKILSDLYHNPYKPMINKIISGLYSPGSAFKMITALAALSKKIITKHTRFNCSGDFHIGNYKYHCWKWKYGGHGSLNLEEAIAQSCDVYFYNLAMLLSPEEIAKVANDFGLGIETGIDIPGEKMGIIPTKYWKKQHRRESWTKGDTLNMSIGQGFMLSTPIQLTRMISIMANGLKPITPYLAKINENYNVKNLPYKKEHIDIILNGMDKVVNGPQGTARHSAISDDVHFRFSGKTGSSQVVHITDQQRREFKTVSDDYWKKEHAIFVGYASIDEKPKYSICVLIEHGGGGSSKAAPVARDIFLKLKTLV
ncbi:MAG: penicillin-binding protein 2 [Holosporales bacterium]|jgi:penicillin-binding protein 2|nr:penicillin-binding protein 2 [Holosporales bacterium]